MSSACAERFIFIRADYRAADVLEIGEATTEAFNKVNKAVHVARKEEQKLTKTHWIAVRDLEVHEVRDHSDA